MSDPSRDRILARRARFVTAALLSAGMACHQDKPSQTVSVVPAPAPTPGVLDDSDGDGILDVNDKCPNEPEDYDGFEDEDGCPDPDNDKDGIPDMDDKCPNVPGAPPDGCDKPKSCLTIAPHLIITEVVHFGEGDATLSKEAQAILQQVMKVMQAHQDLTIVIHGHADKSEKNAFELGERRAESVRNGLISRGVAANRMKAQSEGMSVPMGDPNTKEGRAQNRRVSFETFPL